MEQKMANNWTTALMRKPNNALTIPFDDTLSFFRNWCVFINPFMKLTNRETDVVAAFLQQRYELSKVISDPVTLDTMLMTDRIKKKVAETAKVTQPHFYVIMSNLKKIGIIVNGILNPRIVPNIRPTDNGCFQLLILFKKNENK